ncbi:unnamed protein product [Paramecium primaurelia]|uniref:Transmembrane protein n=1 Tax=Paramecium primaurelia TaxID=5886 RepID=A0A8S1PGT4_PARPR|nr:unnamed protein product [Paramecium primaurelia]
MFFVLLISYSIALSCTMFDGDYLKLVAHKNEYLYYPISYAFKDWRDFAKYELIDHNNKIQLIQPIQLLNNEIIDETHEDYKIIKFDGVQRRERYWLNQYAILRIINNQYQLIYNFQQWYSNQDRMPKFDKYIDIGSTDQIKCFDFVWINSKSLIIDCMEMINEQEINYFYIIQIGDQILKTKRENTYPYSRNQERNIYIQSKYLYRVTKKNQYNNENQVEIFEYNSQTLELTLFTKINSQFFVDNNFTQDYEDYENFQILDFKYSDTYQFSFLDDLQNIIYLSYYYDEWTLTIEQTKYKIHSYDIDFKSKIYIGIGDSFFYNSQYPSSQLILSFDTSNYIPYMMDNYCNLVSSESIIQIVANEISFTKLGDFSKVLIDSKNNEIFSIQGNRILRFFNHYSVSLLYHPVDNDDFNIYQAQVNYKGCTLNIEYQTIASDSQQLIQIRKDEFMFWSPFFASSISQINYFNLLVQGPNISIAILNEQEKISDHYYQTQPQKQITVDNYPVSNYVYLEIIEYTRINTFQLMIISQDDQLKLTLKICVYIDFKFQCSRVEETQLDFQLTKQNTAISCFMDFVEIVTLISSEKLSFISFHQPNYFSMKIFPLDKEQEIDTIAYFTYLLVLSSSKQQVVYAYSLIQEMILMYQFSSQDYVFIKPNQLFNQQQDVQTFIHQLFIFNKQDQLLIIMYLDFSLHYVVNQIQLNEVQNIKVQISKNRFVVVQEKKNNNYEILIYNMENKCNIVLEKTLPLYSYVIDNLENIALSLNLDALYVKSQNKLLIYLLNNPSHNSLFKEIIIDKDVKDIFGIGNYLLYMQKQELIIYYIQTQLAFGYNINMNNDIFIQLNQTQVQFTNNKSQFNLTQKFKYVNMNTQIELYDEKLQIVTKLKDEQHHNMIQDMGSNWYSGQVIKFQSLNNNNLNDIKIIQPINETQHIFFNVSRSVKEFDETKLFVLSDYTYSLIEKTNGKLVKEFKFLDENYQCKSILYAQNQNYIVSCSQGTKEMIFGISCKNQICESSKGLSISISLRKAYIFEKTLFCIGQNSLYVYGIKESILEIEKAKFIGDIQFDPDYYSNTIIMIKSNHYNLYSFNFQGQLLIKELKILDDQLIQFNKLVIDVKEYLNKEYYMDNQLVEIQVLSTNLEDELFQGKFLFFAKQGAHFGMNYNFTCNDSGCQLKNQEVFSVIQGYEDFILFEKYIPTIQLQNDLLLILYQDWRSSSKILAAYRLPQNYSKNFPIQFFGAIEFTNQFYRIEKQLISYKLNNKEYLLFNNYNYSILTMYEVTQSPKIVYNGIIKSDVQYIQVKNHFKNVILMLNIDVEKTEKSYLWLWILLGVVGGLFCIGAGLYLYKKKKKEDTLI